MLVKGSTKNLTEGRMEKMRTRKQNLVQCSRTSIPHKMKREGIGSIIELSWRSGVNQPTVSGLVGGILSPKNKKGEWRKGVISLSVFFECLPGELFGIKKKSHARDFHNV